MIYTSNYIYAMKKKMNMVIAQSGGPSMVINQSLVGAVLEARK